MPIVAVCLVVPPLTWSLRGPALLSDQPPPGPGAAVAAAVLGLAPVLMLACGLACVTALLLRFRRARGVERQQLKWLLYACAITVVAAIVTRPGSGAQGDVLLLLATPLFAAIPVATGVAILRHRLYDIDRIVNRTLVYGLLTAVLGLGYAGVVLVLGPLLGRDQSNLAVAAATLVVAALFQPARRRIQAAVDRRFNRRRYDAARIIDAFSARLRDEIDLDSLSSEPLAVVDRSIEPVSASLWLRPPGAPGR